MTDLERLLADKANADAALADVEAQLLEDLAEAKDAYGADPSSEGKAAKQAAAEALRLYRQVVRSGRSGLLAGDTYVSEG